MSYNLTGFENATHILSIYEAVDQSSNGLLSGLFLLCVFVVVLIGLLRFNPATESITAASAVTTIASLFMLLAGLIGITYVILPTLMFSVGVVALYVNNKV